MQTEVSALDQRLEDKGVRLLILICLVALVNVITTSTTEAQQSWAPQSWANQQDSSNWWVEIGAAGFDRPSKAFGIPLITNSVTNAVLLSAEDVTDLETSFGANVSFGGRTRSGQLWEFETSVVNWDEVHDINGPNLATPFTLQPVDNIDLSVDSDLYSIEMSAKRTVLPGLTLSFGPRYFRLEELLRFETDTTVTNIFGTFTALTRNDFDVQNSMIGLQAGFQFNQPITQLMYIQGHGKFGGYNNNTSFTSFSSDNLGGNPIVNTIDKSTGSFIGEVGGTLYMDVVPGSIRTFAGYEATWVDGVALAPSQALQFGAVTTSIETTNTLFFQQFKFGVSFTR